MGSLRRTKPPLELRLYVVGNAPNSAQAIANLKAICDEHFIAGHKVEIIDLLLEPGRALADGIIVTPTLIKLLPLPTQRLVGSLNDKVQVLSALRTK
jgi:circadian clock protein KaiB